MIAARDRLFLNKSTSPTATFVPIEIGQQAFCEVTFPAHQEFSNGSNAHGEGVSSPPRRKPRCLIGS